MVRAGGTLLLVLDSYVLRLVRRMRSDGTLAGVLEDVQTGTQSPFSGTDELIDLLCGPTRSPADPAARKPCNGKEER